MNAPDDRPTPHDDARPAVPPVPLAVPPVAGSGTDHGSGPGSKISRGRRLALLAGGLGVAAVVGIAATLGIAQGSVIAGTAVAADVTLPAAVAPLIPGQSSSSGSAGSGSTGSGSTGSGDSSGTLSPWGSQLVPGGESGTGGQYGGNQLGGGQLSQGSAAALAGATASQQVGVVDIDTVLSYQSAEAAGTGLVLTSTGEILTNNHVIAGSTSITVTIVSSGVSYDATVVGTDAVDDIAVLQLTDAQGLSVANLATATAVGVGDAVTGVGNAGGVGGTPSASPGNVTAINQTITTQAEGSAAAETLHGLIQTNADIQAGDSGGPLFNSADQVVGIDTAAQSGGVGTAGYAIPIATALTIAGQIDAGQGSENIVIGYPAFLGVQLADSSSAQLGTSGAGRYAASSGAVIGGVVSGAPADQAGLTAGDTITAVDGTTIADASALSTALAADQVGQQVTITWVTASGSSQTATATLIAGPAA